MAKKKSRSGSNNWKKLNGKTSAKQEIPSLPGEFVARMREQLEEEAEEFLASFETGGQPTLRINPLKWPPKTEDPKTKDPKIEEPTTEDPKREDSDLPAFFAGDTVAWEEYGRYYDEESAPGKHPLHAAGAYYIQEASAMAPVRYLDPKPGEWVLDLCAAPGGKTSQIGALMQDRGLLVCNEIVSKRAQILSENMERMGLSNILVVSENPLELQNYFEECFDRILVDAPCSGEGMFRKHPETRLEWSEENVRICAERQDEILDCAARMLMPGGRIVFSTCTFAPAEDEESVARFLERHPEFEVVSGIKLYDGMTSSAAGCVRLWPHKLRGEGHFLAVMQKHGEPEADRIRRHSPLKGEQGCSTVDGKTLEVVREFLQNTLKPEWADTLFDPSRFLLFGEQLYLMPHGMPNLKGIKVLRPGLHLGTIRKQRFEPSHALALALPEGAVLHSFPVTEETAREYLKGMTLVGDRDTENGWYRTEYCGLGLGWGKMAAGTLKNHYPKGLRSLA